jgi:hypothetical protein
MPDTFIPVSMENGTCTVSLSVDWLKVKVFATRNRQRFVLREPECRECTVHLDIGDKLLVDVYGEDGEGDYAHAVFALTEQGLIKESERYHPQGGVQIVIQESEPQEPTLRKCRYCGQMHEASQIEECPLKPIADYNRQMDERNRISYENRDKPWLPLHDGE